MNESFERDLRDADPASRLEDAATSGLVRQLALAAQETSERGGDALPWWRRRRVALPLAIGGVVALTGAAVPLGIWINGAEVPLDVAIPIEYTTDTGVKVSCRYGLYFGDPAQRTPGDERAAEFVRRHDWSGIGQRIYEEAIANPFEPGPSDDWEVDNQQLRDSFSFNRALGLIWTEIPDDVRASLRSTGATTDCTGQLR